MRMSKLDIGKMNEDERTQLLVNVFKWIEKQGGFVPEKVYWERLLTFPTYYHESIVIAPNDNGSNWEVLMDFRPPSDPYYANQYGTQGGTVMMRKTLVDLFEYHSQKESGIPGKVNDFRFCGLATTPNTKRDHALVGVFARILPRKPTKFKGSWVKTDSFDEYAIIPSNRVYVDMAVNVMIYGRQPYYFEFSGTD